jgi:hypothetical protein
VPCDELPHVLERVIPYLSNKRTMPSIAPSMRPTQPVGAELHADT